MATFGSTPGVTVDTKTGIVGNAVVGREQWLVLIGAGDNAAGSASTNDPVEILSRSDADDKFGAGSDIAQAYRYVRQGGANQDYIKAVMAETTETTETFAGSASGTLSNAPVVYDTDRITAYDQTNGIELDVEHHFGGTPAAPTGDILRLNPNTGEWAIESSTDVEVVYDYADWTSAVQALPASLKQGQFGLFTPLVPYEGLVSDFKTVLDDMRPKYKMGLVWSPIEYNATATDGSPKVDATAYSQSHDDDRIFLAGPTAADGASDADPLYALRNFPNLAGHVAGAAIDQPVFNDRVRQAEPLAQELSQPDAEVLREKGVVPLRDRGDVKIRGNASTFNQTKDEWQRTYFKRRVVDLVIATINEIGQDFLGGILDEGEVDRLGRELSNELKSFVTDLGILEREGQYVETFLIDDNTIGVEVGITPLGVTKQVETTLTVQR